MPTQIELQPLLALPVAAALGAALAFRPRRRGTPSRNPAVIQTQVILAVVGALVMIVVGASVARAFGIVGAASLIRYRAKISDPKDAAVMLACLGVGLAAGVQLTTIAAGATFFLLALLYGIESLERPTFTMFDLSLESKSVRGLRPAVEHLLSRHHARAELRHLASDEMSYSVRVPIGTRMDELSEQLMKLDPAGTLSVDWDQKKART
jgi:uncharacterized membrane protein YhiD involved in acid resistance